MTTIKDRIKSLLKKKHDLLKEHILFLDEWDAELVTVQRD